MIALARRSRARRRFRPAAPCRRSANCRLLPDPRRRVRRRLLAVLGVPAGAALVFLGIRAAYEGELFLVREITFRGLVYANPRVLLAEAGLTRRHSIFEDFAFAEVNLRRDPLVRSARIRREPPGRLIVDVQERAPVAYWSESELWPVDAEGRVLPLQPAHYGWDLPVLLGPRRGRAGPSALQHGRLVDAYARALLRLVIGMRDRVPEISRRISVAELGPEGGVVLHLMGGAREETGEVRLRLETPLEKVALLSDVLRDLELRRRGFKSVDLSFEDQIVVVPLDLPGEGSGGGRDAAARAEKRRAAVGAPAPADDAMPAAQLREAAGPESSVGADGGARPEGLTRPDGSVRTVEPDPGLPARPREVAPGESPPPASGEQPGGEA